MKNLLLLVSFFVTLLADAQYLSTRDISYLPHSSLQYDNEKHLLDIYMTGPTGQKNPVAVFIHGGKWRVGSKKTYRFLGRKLAKHGITTVIINYRLTPVATNYLPMAMDCAHAVKWVYENIDAYGGDKNKIYLYGHSSGGHLSALIASNNRFFDSTGIINPVKGCVLLDPFGLTISKYLQTAPKKDRWMYTVFTKDSLLWKDAAPVNYLREDSLKFLIYNGANSPFKIRNDGIEFYEAAVLKKKSISRTTLPYVGHLGLLFQLYNTKHKLYRKFEAFMK